MLGLQSVHKVHGGDQACFGSRTADVEEVRVYVSWRAEGTEDLAMEGDFGGEVCEMEVTCKIRQEPV